jgi:hypothetical protein
MALDFALAALKFLAILTAGSLAVVGGLVDFRKDGEVTKWGRRALVGTIISTIIAVSVQSVETYKQNIDSKKQDERNETTLREIRRGLYLIKDAEFNATIRISEPPDEVKAYLKRVNPYILRYKRLAERDDAPPGLPTEKDDDAYLLLEDKNVYPRPTSERIAYMALMGPNLVLRIFKDPRKADCFWEADLEAQRVVDGPQDRKLSGFNPLGGVNRRCEDADLEFQIDPPDPAKVSISVGVAKGQVLLHYWSLHATVAESRGEEVASIPDLVGARLSLELRY